MTKGVNTVNLCAIDLSKVFNKVNQHALLPITLLDLLEYWLNNCFSCIKWNCVYSDMFAVRFGVRQGSVLLPILFAVYLNDIFTDHYVTRNSFVVLYADDILLVTYFSITELLHLFYACERELWWLDMRINEKKILLYSNWTKM